MAVDLDSAGALVLGAPGGQVVWRARNRWRVFQMVHEQRIRQALVRVAAFLAYDVS